MDSRVEQEKVHFFEHLSIDRFSSYLRSAFQYTTNILFERWPALVNFRYYQDEILLLLESSLQTYFLSAFNCTYAEYFYGYARKNMGNFFMKGNKKFWVLILTTLMPYIRRKLEKKYNEILREQDDLPAMGQIRYKNFKKGFLFIFKYFHLCIELIEFVFQLKYLLSSETQYYSFFFYLLRQKLQKLEEDNKKSTYFLLEFFKKYFVFALFLTTKFLDWYFQPANSNNNQGNLDNKLVNVPYQKEMSSRNYNYCQLCNKDFRNPTVVAVSGYAFCFTCIEEYVKRHGKCPITHINCSLQGLHKIYKS